MAVMVAVYVAAADRAPALKAKPIVSGVTYGALTYIVMNLIVVPMRFGTGLPPSLVGFATQMFCHIALVGVPIAIVARR